MKILYYSPAPSDACSFYRGVGPLSRLPGVELTICPQEVSWATLSGYDMLFLQRPYLPEHLDLLREAQHQMPVVIDYDDNLLEVPSSNPAWEAYSPYSTKATISQLIIEANAVIVSTDELGRQLNSHVRRSYITIRNAHNDYLFPTTRVCAPREPTVLWRGSRTHDADLLAYADGIIEAARAFPDWRFVFYGSCPWMLEGKIPLTHHKGKGIFQYFKDIVELRPSVMIVPLEDNNFNRAKSNIAAMEGLYAGARPLVPDFMGKPGRIYSGKETFGTHLQFLIELKDAHVKEEWNEVSAKYLLSQINLQRADLFTQVIS